jgi:hypothetical protein
VCDALLPLALLTGPDKRRDMLMVRMLHCVNAIQQADGPAP